LSSSSLFVEMLSREKRATAFPLRKSQIFDSHGDFQSERAIANET
jgi:hypothetical protein